jgi:hypothetical protein
MGVGGMIVPVENTQIRSVENKRWLICLDFFLAFN